MNDTASPTEHIDNVAILMVDDEVSVRKVVCRILQQMGITPCEAENGQDALSVLERDAFDIVITDVVMPRMDGIELTRRIKANYTSDVILLTGQIHQFDYESAIDLGASDFIQKPIIPEELILRIKRVIRERELRNELILYHKELYQAQKFESVGLLAAGIAHEINTPIQYIGDNTTFLKESFGKMVPIIDRITQVMNTNPESAVGEPNHGIEKLIEPLDWDYLKDEIPLAIDQTLSGARQVSRIVRSMKTLSHPGKGEHVAVNIHDIIENVVTVSTNEWKHLARIQCEFDSDVPPILCEPGEIGQVLLNIVINAIHAIKEKKGANPDEKGMISIKTQNRTHGVVIEIKDTGTGVPQELMEKIFDPFFTTKDVGKGTGQGLSIARSVIVDHHNGRINAASEIGKGTCFTISLPNSA